MREFEVGVDNRSYGEIKIINGMMEFKDYSKHHKKPKTTRFKTKAALDKYLLNTKQIDTWEIKELGQNKTIYKHKTLGEIETFNSEQHLNRSLAKENVGAWKIHYRVLPVCKQTHPNYYVLQQMGWLTVGYEKYTLNQAKDFFQKVEEHQKAKQNNWLSWGLALMTVTGLSLTPFTSRNNLRKKFEQNKMGESDYYPYPIEYANLVSTSFSYGAIAYLSNNLLSGYQTLFNFGATLPKATFIASRPIIYCLLASQVRLANSHEIAPSADPLDLYSSKQQDSRTDPHYLDQGAFTETNLKSKRYMQPHPIMIVKQPGNNWGKPLMHDNKLVLSRANYTLQSGPIVEPYTFYQSQLFTYSSAEFPPLRSDPIFEHRPSFYGLYSNYQVTLLNSDKEAAYGGKYVLVAATYRNQLHSYVFTMSTRWPYSQLASVRLNKIVDREFRLMGKLQNDSFALLYTNSTSRALYSQTFDHMARPISSEIQLATNIYHEYLSADTVSSNLVTVQTGGAQKIKLFTYNPLNTTSAIKIFDTNSITISSYIGSVVTLSPNKIVSIWGSIIPSSTGEEHLLPTNYYLQQYNVTNGQQIGLRQMLETGGPLFSLAPLQNECSVVVYRQKNNQALSGQIISKDNSFAGSSFKVAEWTTSEVANNFNVTNIPGSNSFIATYEYLNNTYYKVFIPQLLLKEFNVTGIIPYVEDNEKNLPNISISQDFYHGNINVMLKLSNSSLADLKLMPIGTAVPIYNSANSAWQLSGSINDVNAALARVTVQPKANLVGSFNVTVDIDDGLYALSKIITFSGTSLNDKPQLLPTHIVMCQGDRVNITNSIFKATDVDDANILFKISNIQAGFFQKNKQNITLNNDTFIISQGELLVNNWEFVHNGTPQKPGFTVIASDGNGDSTSQNAQIDFHTPPTLKNNRLMTKEGEASLIKLTNLEAESSDSNPELIGFHVTNSSHCYFINNKSPSFHLTFFKQNEISNPAPNQEITLVHDGSEEYPEIRIRLISEFGCISPEYLANVIHDSRGNDLPRLRVNHVKVKAGIKNTINATQLAAEDPDLDQNPNEIEFIVVRLERGTIRNIGKPGSPQVASFTQDDINKGYIILETDNSNQNIALEVQLKDSTGALTPTPISINFEFIDLPPTPVPPPGSPPYIIISPGSEPESDFSTWKKGIIGGAGACIPTALLTLCLALLRRRNRNINNDIKKIEAEKFVNPEHETISIETIFSEEAIKDLIKNKIGSAISDSAKREEIVNLEAKKLARHLKKKLRNAMIKHTLTTCGNRLLTDCCSQEQIQLAIKGDWNGFINNLMNESGKFLENFKSDIADIGDIKETLNGYVTKKLTELKDSIAIDSSNPEGITAIQNDILKDTTAKQAPRPSRRRRPTRPSQVAAAVLPQQDNAGEENKMHDEASAPTSEMVEGRGDQISPVPQVIPQPVVNDDTQETDSIRDDSNRKKRSSRRSRRSIAVTGKIGVLSPLAEGSTNATVDNIASETDEPSKKNKLKQHSDASTLDSINTDDHIAVRLRPNSFGSGASPSGTRSHSTTPPAVRRNPEKSKDKPSLLRQSFFKHDNTQDNTNGLPMAVVANNADVSVNLSSHNRGDYGSIESALQVGKGQEGAKNAPYRGEYGSISNVLPAGEAQEGAKNAPYRGEYGSISTVLPAGETQEEAINVSGANKKR